MSTERTPDDRQKEREEGPGVPLREGVTDPRDDEPHHAIANEAANPDETEYPDPYDRRPDPRAPEHADEDGSDFNPDSANPKPPSTSEPHPPHSYDELKPVKGDRED